MLEILLSSPIGILSLITVVGAIAIVVGWVVIWAYWMRKER
ncbi:MULTISPECIES: DUF3149 domain-containing protein [Thiohalorhabdus]|uniref:DUF3149 domain-containing protein n=1 Tax=Thiohalorhabdus denitrificans TaxID=381306 RepID=A0A1G5EN86_9GAMM|nr:DUF3149 domain-containing protein [Thiohalorhabdus denitrificans]SCY28439.1 hypothetical protein SAMN05661077_1704 [Thiohalorhabdus denitrificans]